MVNLALTPACSLEARSRPLSQEVGCLGQGATPLDRDGQIVQQRRVVGPMAQDLAESRLNAPEIACDWLRNDLWNS